jgi:cytochrome c oxidase assembly protein subunit 15
MNTTSSFASGFASGHSDAARRQVAFWLLVCAALVFVMVVVGGVTRLTRSGLSIVEWQPIAGTLPPLTETAWQDMFTKYQATPEYVKVNRGMSLDEFKGIFWWEYIHRLIGRTIGLVFFLPFVWFLAKRQIPWSAAPKYVGILLLGGAQGAIGWWMVKSGLVDLPRVSHVRLAIHLGMAFFIFAVLLWTALGLLARERQPLLSDERQRLARYATALAVLVFVMVLSGALVAGTRAGYAYNTFPLMDGRFVPAGLGELEPWWDNLFHNLTTVQFNHRMIAWALAFIVPAFWWACRRADLPVMPRRAVNLLLAMLVVQITLGITTLLFHVPVALGAAHQGGALVLFGLTLWTAHALRRS